MTRIANATTEPEEHKEIEITPEIIEAGRRVPIAAVLPDEQILQGPVEIAAEEIGVIHSNGCLRLNKAYVKVLHKIVGFFSGAVAQVSSTP